jgi:chromatin remodeling complex protein RSC6
MKIENIDNLKSFVLTHFDKLSIDELNKVISQSLGAFIMDKTLSKNEVIELINEYQSKWNQTPIEDRPLFLLKDTF